MKTNWTWLALWLMLALAAGCAPADRGSAGGQVTAPVDTVTLPLEVTQPAPTPPPVSTDVPWWGGRIATVDAVPKYIVKPTGIAYAPDGSLYVADAGAHRILHLDREGGVLHVWGTFAESSEGAPAPAGAFNEPWGLEVAPDGSVYVADTWNHRIQKFDGEGRFLLAWGEGGIGSEPYRFFGPRDLALSSGGLVLVSDTGNKRVVVYSPEGRYLGQAGGEGTGTGQFDEPVGLAMHDGDHLYVADQGNRRVQVFAVASDGSLTWEAAWPVAGWRTNAAEYKPYLCTLPARIFTTDPETGAVHEYSLAGERLLTYDLNSLGTLTPGIVYGVACDPAGGLWVSDFQGGASVLVNILPRP
jgi:DNA-binding beta-propeller fold protein YncE